MKQHSIPAVGHKNNPPVEPFKRPYKRDFSHPIQFMRGQEKRPELSLQPLIFVSATFQEIPEYHEWQQQERHQATAAVHCSTAFRLQSRQSHRM